MRLSGKRVVDGVARPMKRTCFLWLSDCCVFAYI